jgi:PIN domain nuclease of toxin-antitoxin system
VPRLLLDTHALLWALIAPERLGDRIRATLTEPSTTVLVSVVCAWEIEIKRALGKLRAPSDLPGALAHSGFTALDLDLASAIRGGRLPLLHRDPFDRALVAQAQEHGLTLVTDDGRIAQYDVPVLAASA